jgi:hypothetical protein
MDVRPSCAASVGQETFCFMKNLQFWKARPPGRLAAVVHVGKWPSQPIHQLGAILADGGSFNGVDHLRRHFVDGLAFLVGRARP